jgi:flagellar motor switch protein FliM
MNANQQTAHLTRSVEEMRSHLERGNEPHGVCASQPRQGSAAQLRQLRTMHESLARGFASALSNLLRTPAEARLVGVDPMAYGHFVSRIEPPACFYILAADPLDDRLMLDFEPSILHPMLDRLLGGMITDEPPPGRPMTEIELCLAARIVRLFLEQCRTAWQKMVDLNLDVQQFESNPRLSRILPADESVVVLSFELGIAELRGMMRFCVPYRAIGRIDETLVPEKPLPVAQPESRTLATVEVTLAETPVQATELADLRVGDIIVTETPADSPAVVSIDGVGRFLAKPGSYQGRKAVRLIETLEPDDRLSPP